MKNKKGQGGMSTELMIGLVILLVVAAVLVWSFTQSGKDFWSKITGSKGGTTLDTAIGGCNQLFNTEARDGFCADFKDVNLDGKNQYVTCSYLASKNRLSGKLDCDPTIYLASIKANCEQLKKTGITINGQLITTSADCALVPLEAATASNPKPATYNMLPGQIAFEGNK